MLRLHEEKKNIKEDEKLFFDKFRIVIEYCSLF